MEDPGLGFNHGVLLVGRYFLCWLEFTSKYLIFPSYVYGIHNFAIIADRKLIVFFFPHYLQLLLSLFS